MRTRYLHIITHDVPYPADYGGVIDLFYKIKTLHANDIQILLHCFVHKRPPQNELDKYCKEVHYYPRKTGWKGISLQVPYLVNSRKDPALINRLLEDEHPILMEGVHCSYYLQKGLLKNRTLLLRLHNSETAYYHHLGIHEKNPLRKFYFEQESRLLKKYEQSLSHKVKIAAVSEQDVAIYEKQWHAPDIHHLPVFIPYTRAEGLPGNGFYCLYHGNLEINENEEAASWLLKEVFSELDIPFVVAGKNPSEKLRYLAKQNNNTCLVENPSDAELHDMIAKAQINILPSFNQTGIKLKLLNALYNGRHCLVNRAGVEGSGLENCCHIAEGTSAFQSVIIQLYAKPYLEESNAYRNQVLGKLYSNQRNAEWLFEVFWAGPDWQ